MNGVERVVVVALESLDPVVLRRRRVKMIGGSATVSGIVEVAQLQFRLLAGIIPSGQPATVPRIHRVLFRALLSVDDDTEDSEDQ